MVDQKKEKLKMGFGLKKLSPDSRDFVLGAIVLPISLKEIPDNFAVSEPLKIKDQGNSDLCTAFALTSVSEDQEGFDLNPEYQFAKTKQIMGEYESWGADLRSSCKSAIKFGSLEQISAHIPNNPRDWNNWETTLDKIAKIHSKRSYFKISSLGYKDMFDALRASLWRYRSERRSIITGCMWENEWTNAEQGIIPKKEGIHSFGHAFKLFGQKIIDGELYLIAQLSNGEEIGNKGLFYFPREVVNRKFSYGAYHLQDLDPEEVKKQLWSIWRRIWEQIKSYFNNWLRIALR